MEENYQTHNYIAHGGRETVIGGKLTFLPGATVSGLREALSASEGGAEELGEVLLETPKIPFIPDSRATSAAALREDFNSLLGVLRASGFMKNEASAE